MASGRLQSFDFLRGVAILGVVVFHVFLNFDPHIKVISALAGLGVYGVQLFFMVSALTMSLMWDRRSGEDRPIIKFYIRRFFRIAPPFWLAIMGYLLLNNIGQPAGVPSGIGLRHIATTATFLHGFWPDTINTVVPGGWSIAVEMTFYAVFPFIVALNATSTTLTVAAFAVYVANIALISPFFGMVFSKQPADILSEFLYYQFFYQAPIFLIGMALFKVITRDGQKAYPFAAIILSWLAAAFLLKGVLSVHSSPFFWLAVSALVTFTWICLRNDVFFTPIDRLGKVSYSTYLTHFAIIQMVKFLFAMLSIDMHSLAAFFGALALTIAFCYIIAAFLQVTLETWSSKMGVWLIRKLLPEGEDPVASTQNVWHTGGG
jgi:exopolysaccharide production protein ExoZ